MGKLVDTVTIEYDGKLPSVNHMYGRTKFHGMYLKPEGKALKQAILYKYSDRGLPKDVELYYDMLLYGNWYNKKGAKTRIKKRDSNNLIKLIIDACCDALGVDDSQIFREIVHKIHRPEKEGFKITFYLMDYEE